MIRRAVISLAKVFDPRAYFGPIFYKEMLVAGRRSFTHWARLFTGLLLAFTLWMMLQGYSSSELEWTEGIDRLRAYERLAPVTTMLVGWTMACMLPLIAAALGSGTMIDEKKARTMPSLLSTPMSAWTIVASKVTSRILQIFILALIGLPVLLAARTFGGLGFEMVIAFFTVGICQAIFTACCATWNSLTSPKAWGAMTFGVLLTVGLNGLPFAVPIVGAVSGSSEQFIIYATASAMHISPIGSLFMLTLGDMGGGAPVFPTLFPGSAWVSSSALCLLFSLLAMWRTAARLRVVTTGKHRQRVRRRKDGSLKVRANPERSRSRTIFGNPVAWRELRQPIIKGSRRFRWIAGLVAFCALAYIYLRVPPEETGLHAVVLMICFFIATIYPINATTGVFISEREARTLDVLLSTPMSAWSITLGKLAGAFPKPLLIMQLAILHIIVFSAVALFTGVEYVSVWLIPQLLLITIGTVALVASTGLIFAVVCKRNAVAMVSNIGLWLFAWAGIWIVFAILDIYLYDTGMERTLKVINPFYMSVSALQGGLVEYNARPPSQRYLEDLFYSSTIGPTAFTLLLAVWAGISVAIAMFSTFVASRILAAKTLRRV